MGRSSAPPPPTYVLEEIKKAGFTEPTPIQSQGWPMALKGRDLSIAETGFGKTLSYSAGIFLWRNKKVSGGVLGAATLSCIFSLIQKTKLIREYTKEESEAVISSFSTRIIAFPICSLFGEGCYSGCFKEFQKQYANWTWRRVQATRG